MPKIHVLNHNGDKLFDAAPAEAARMLALHQAKYTADGRCLRLTGFTPQHEHPCRTYTSRGGLLAAVGRSQRYTVSERGQVSGFKRIFPEDLSIFRAAILDCFTSAFVKLHGPV